MSEQVTILGIETSCDETAAAVVARKRDGTVQILAETVRSQVEEHAPYGGVVPEMVAEKSLLFFKIVARKAVAERSDQPTEGTPAHSARREPLREGRPRRARAT